jgi:hypothetical protein
MSTTESPRPQDAGRHHRLILIGSILAVLAVGFGIWWYVAHPSFAKYAPALEAMKNHNVTVDASGRVDLSKQFPGLTPRDFACVTWLDDGNFRAMFPIYDGEGSALNGLMYTSRPLTEEDTSPRLSAIRFDERVIAVGSYAALVVDEKLNTNWYRVSYKIH